MRRKKLPLERMDVADPEAKGKVAMVLSVLSGEKAIAEACRETGLAPLQYYKLEDKMVRAMVQAAMLPGAGRRGDPGAEIRTLSEETEALRREQRRMQSLVRITRKVLGLGNRIPRKKGPGRPPKALSVQGSVAREPVVPRVAREIPDPERPETP